jgi:hypothetical protein
MWNHKKRGNVAKVASLIRHHIDPKTEESGTHTSYSAHQQDKVHSMTRPTILMMEDEDLHLLQSMLRCMQEQGMVRRSRSTHRPALAMVYRKKDHSLNLCVDYRQLNAASKQTSMPPPHDAGMFLEMQVFRYLTRLSVSLLLTPNRCINRC